jgi:hypothetical protein
MKLTDPFATVHKKERRKVDPAARFWAKVDASGDCWEWTGARNAQGYGVFGVGDGTVLAHRFAAALTTDPPRGGLVSDHLCRNRACVNPAHLQQVTGQTNARRGNTGLHHRLKRACPKGHPYNETNTAVQADGGRACKTCNRAYYQRRAA